MLRPRASRIARPRQTGLSLVRECRTTLRGRAIPDTSAADRSLFREVNDRVREVSANWVDREFPVGFLCECGASDCVDVVQLTVGDYEQIRAKRGRFLVVGGHELPADEVVERINGCVVVDRS
jgi:hypothetical protein